jgi:hypothetical protein
MTHRDFIEAQAEHISKTLERAPVLAPVVSMQGALLDRALREDEHLLVNRITQAKEADLHMAELCLETALEYVKHAREQLATNKGER